jgi:TolB protein
MRKILSALIILATGVSPVLAYRDIGTVDVQADNRSIPVRVIADRADLEALAQRAFSAHGRYRIAEGGRAAYTFRFSLAGPAQVRVDISRGAGAQPVASALVPGTSARNALLRAADVAVEKTNGMGLRGFFASRLAFIDEMSGHKEVYVSDLFCGEVRRITNDRAIALSPRWAPDGNRIIYTSFYHSGAPDIFLMDLGTNQRMTFESFKGTNSGARFSPNGEQVAMILSGEGETQVYVSDANGRRVSRRTYNDSVKASPCWSPDGSRIVFASSPGPQLYMIPAGGGAAERITHGISRYCAEPDWSTANPNKIAFTASFLPSGGGYQIVVLDLSTGQGKKVSGAPFDGIEPCWLADGRHLVYTARTRYDSVLSILDTETGKSTAISRRLGPAHSASVWLR